MPVVPETVMVAQDPVAGVRMLAVIIWDMVAATYELAHALVSAWQAPSAERMR